MLYRYVLLRWMGEIMIERFINVPKYGWMDGKIDRVDRLIGVRIDKWMSRLLTDLLNGKLKLV